MQVYKFNVPTFGKDVVFDVSHKVRAEQFKMFSEALKIAKMTDYVPLFVKEAEVCISSGALSCLYNPVAACVCKVMEAKPHSQILCANSTDVFQQLAGGRALL